MTRYEQIEAKRLARASAADRNGVPPGADHGRGERASVRPVGVSAFVAKLSSACTRGRQWCVLRVYDNGRRVKVKSCSTYELAERAAGFMRDDMTDEQCGEGWNYLPGRA